MGGVRMICIDENKLTNYTIQLIGEAYGISRDKYNMSTEEGYYAYIEEVMDMLYEETEKQWEKDAGRFYDAIMEDLELEGRLLPPKEERNSIR